jgi:putative methionine-R-sulfoxide reductase with GAF domain
VKTYRSTRVLLAQIEELLSKNKPQFGCSPLDQVIEMLAVGRHYPWVGIYLALAENQQHLLGSRGEAALNATSAPQTRSKMLISMRLGSREIGVLAAESDRQFPFGSEDRVLLEKVADALARFLAGSGKYLVREAREKAASANPDVPSRRPQSTSGARLSAAAVGEN